MTDLSNRVALVTGGSSGIGRAAALMLGEAGARVAVVARRRKEGEAVAAEIRDSGGSAVFIQADVTDDGSVEQAVDACVAEFGSLDIAFNNAGSWTPSPLSDVSPQLWRDEIDTNLTSIYLCMRHQLPIMVAQAAGGVVINNASVLGVVGVGAGLAPYVAAKHGVVGLGRAAALEYAQTPVRINTIAPGGVDTPHFRATFGADQAGADAFAGMHPMRRLATEEEIASLVVYLASDGAAFIHGATLAVDGGWSAQ
jgi:NAD(P)-dependent dehydrogenase (short-subunit alcohol dehydrogenase family)